MDEKQKPLGIGTSFGDAAHRQSVIDYANALDRIARHGNKGGGAPLHTPQFLSGALHTYNRTYMDTANRLAELTGCANRVSPGRQADPIRPLFQHGDEPPHERVWHVGGVSHVYELEIIDGKYVLVFKVRV